MSELFEEFEEKYFCVSLDTFLYNAGIIGFIQVLKTLQAQKGTSKTEKNDYFIDGQDLFVRKDFLLNADLAQGYIDAVCEKFGEKTNIVATIKNLEFLTTTADIQETLFTEKLKLITSSLKAASIKTGCETLKENNNSINIQENIELIEKSKNDTNKIKEYLSEILINFNNIKIKQTLLMKNIMYTKIKLFWGNKSFLNRANSKNEIKNEYVNSFEKPLKAIIENTKSHENYNCIMCGYSILKDIDTTFLFEVGVDTARKKSAFWNQNPDSFICPLCNLIYSCSPLGFIDLGGTLVFVNQNDSIETLLQMNKAVEFTEEEKNKKYKIYNTIIQRALAIKTKELNSIQVIIRDEKHYSANIIGKDILHVIKVREKELHFLSKIYIKDSAVDYINIFDECIQNIIENKNQWNLIFKSLKSETKSYGFIFSILKIQITQKYMNMEGYNVDGNINKALFASKAGHELRNKLGGVKSENIETESPDADNKLRGIVYQLVNSVHTGNTDLFFSITTRLYTSLNIKIPTIFMDAFKSDDSFKEIGYAYIIGLKGGYYAGKDKVENSQGE